MKTPIYCPFNRTGKIPNEVLQLIQKTLNNEVAREHLGSALSFTFSQLSDRQIYVCEYGNIEIWGVLLNSSAIYATFSNVKFLNEDLQHMSKDKLINLFND